MTIKKKITVQHKDGFHVSLLVNPCCVIPHCEWIHGLKLLYKNEPHSWYEAVIIDGVTDKDDDNDNGTDR